MAGLEYRHSYFESPEDLELKLDEFLAHVAGLLRQKLTGPEADDQTVVGVYGIASLFGFVRLSDLMRAIEGDVRGRNRCSSSPESTKTATIACSTHATAGTTSRSRSPGRRTEEWYSRYMKNRAIYQKDPDQITLLEPAASRP